MKCGGLFQTWGGVAERIKKGIWWWLLGATSSVGWEPVPPTPPLSPQGKPEGRYARGWGREAGGGLGHWGDGASEEGPQCLQGDLFRAALEGGKLAPRKRERQGHDLEAQKPGLLGLTYSITSSVTVGHCFPAVFSAVK